MSTLFKPNFEFVNCNLFLKIKNCYFPRSSRCCSFGYFSCVGKASIGVTSSSSQRWLPYSRFSYGGAQEAWFKESPQTIPVGQALKSFLLWYFYGFVFNCFFIVIHSSHSPSNHHLHFVTNFLSLNSF